MSKDYIDETVCFYHDLNTRNSFFPKIGNRYSQESMPVACLSEAPPGDVNLPTPDTLEMTYLPFTPAVANYLPPGGR